MRYDLLDLSDDRRAAKPWLPADDRDVTGGLVIIDDWGLPACVWHGSMSRVDPVERIYRCQEMRCGVGARVEPAPPPPRRVVDTRAWTMGHYPSPPYPPLDVEAALAELRLFNHAAAAAVLEARIRELENREGRGIDTHVTPHSLRRTFVTLGRDAGIPDRDLMASTGHASPEMLDYYDRARDAVERDAGDQFATWLDPDNPQT